MESLVGKGLTKSIGISNFQGSLILDLLRYAKIRPATLQIEHHPYLVQPTLIKLAQDEGIAVTAYSSFGPQSFIELEWKKAKDTPVLFEHPVIKAAAKMHEKTPAQILLRWATQRGLAVIPKSNNQERLQQNLHVTDFDLADGELQAISALDRGLRFNDPTDVSFPPTTISQLNCNISAVSWHYAHLCLKHEMESADEDGSLWSKTLRLFRELHLLRRHGLTLVGMEYLHLHEPISQTSFQKETELIPHTLMSAVAFHERDTLNVRPCELHSLSTVCLLSNLLSLISG